MKKTKHINLDAMRKKARYFALTPLALAVMTGCVAESKEEVKFVTDADDCVKSTSMTAEQCEAAYARAVADAASTAPRYQKAEYCEQEFGRCQQDSNGFFMPFMAGYIVSGLVNDMTNSRNRQPISHPTYIYRGSGSHNNQIMTADGRSIGTVGQNSYRVNPQTFDRQPQAITTRTLDRGGFGSQAAAKSAWGSESAASRNDNNSNASRNSENRSSASRNSNSNRNSGTSRGGGWGG